MVGRRARHAHDLPDAWMHALAAGGGSVWLTYLSSSRTDGTYDVLATSSADRGLTWSEPLALNKARATTDGTANGWLGDYMWVDLAGGHLAAIWPDLRSGVAPEISMQTATVAG